jgi:hypothetical protein
MIAPRHATMFCFVQTDAELEQHTLDLLTGVCVKRSFDRISVDGQLSTSDTVFAIASGASGVRIEPESPDELAFGEALDAFTYHGGFALALARRGGAVLATDEDEAAVGQAVEEAGQAGGAGGDRGGAGLAAGVGGDAAGEERLPQRAEAVPVEAGPHAQVAVHEHDGDVVGRAAQRRAVRKRLRHGLVLGDRNVTAQCRNGKESSSDSAPSAGMLRTGTCVAPLFPATVPRASHTLLVYDAGANRRQR